MVYLIARKFGTHHMYYLREWSVARDSGDMIICQDWTEYRERATKFTLSEAVENTRYYDQRFIVEENDECTV